jgi:cytochrome c biogenesis factor
MNPCNCYLTGVYFKSQRKYFFMSRIMFCLMLVLMVVAVAAQSKSDSILTADAYLEKSKRLKSTGAVMVGVGIAATVMGIVMAHNAHVDDNPLSYLNKLPGQMLIVAGVTTALCSIPIYIKAGKYQRQAAALSIGNRNIISPFQSGFIASSQPTITLSIKF